MNSIEVLERQISMYHTVFLCCLILLVFFLLIDSLIFWKFEIKQVYGYLTGKMAKKTIEQMIKNNDEYDDETEVLAYFPEEKIAGRFELIKEIMFIHTEEEI